MKSVNLIMMVLFMMIATLSFGQERVNTRLPKIALAPTTQLIKAKGWIKNPEGQWIFRNNRIPAFISNEYKLLLDYEKDGLGTDNFISYQFRDISINDTLYTIFIKKYKDGYYKYETILEGWVNYTSVDYYVFSKNESKLLDSVHNDTINIVSLKLKCSNTLIWIDEKTYINDISQDIIKELAGSKYNYKSNELFFVIKPNKQKNIVRFNINDSIDEYYYEVDFLTFNTFIKIMI